MSDQQTMPAAAINDKEKPPKQPVSETIADEAMLDRVPLSYTLSSSPYDLIPHPPKPKKQTETDQQTLNTQAERAAYEEAMNAYNKMKKAAEITDEMKGLKISEAAFTAAKAAAATQAAEMARKRITITNVSVSGTFDLKTKIDTFRLFSHNKENAEFQHGLSSACYFRPYGQGSPIMLLVYPTGVCTITGTSSQSELEAEVERCANALRGYQIHYL